MNTKESNPFGSQLVVIAEETAVTKDDIDKKKTKSVDLVKLNLTCIPSLEKAKSDLLEVADNTSDADLKKTIADFVNQLEGIEEKVLGLTMQGIKKERQGRLSMEAPAGTAEITPGMFSGVDPIPESPAK